MALNRVLQYIHVEGMQKQSKIFIFYFERALRMQKGRTAKDQSPLSIIGGNTPSVTNWVKNNNTQNTTK